MVPSDVAPSKTSMEADASEVPDIVAELTVEAAAGLVITGAAGVTLSLTNKKS